MVSSTDTNKNGRNVSTSSYCKKQKPEYPENDQPHLELVIRSQSVTLGASCFTVFSQHHIIHENQTEQEKPEKYPSLT